MTEGFTWQALNALVFFYRDVCGMEQVDLEVRLRKTTPRLPVVLEVKEVMAVLDRIDAKYALMAKIQYGGGLRLSELLRLRVKDVDEGRGRVKGFASRDGFRRACGRKWRGRRNG